MKMNNTGNSNSGNYNSGNYNSGYSNSGNYNSGDYNSGDFNSGNSNSGNSNSGYSNSGNYNSGDCNTDTPSVRLFNKDSGWEYLGIKHSKFREIINSKLRPLCQWISEINMSEGEKKENPNYKTVGGYLKVNQELFNENDFTKEEIDFLWSVPSFCPKIFKKCTGLDIENNKKKIIIDGKEILISKESFEEIKKQFV